MKFARDILLIDIQTTGADPKKDFPLQLAAVLLDKDGKRLNDEAKAVKGEFKTNAEAILQI